MITTTTGCTVEIQGPKLMSPTPEMAGVHPPGFSSFGLFAFCLPRSRTPSDIKSLYRADMLNRGRWKHPYGQREHCAKGHHYETQGFYISKTDGSRVCRTCQREAKRAQRAEKRITQ